MVPALWRHLVEDPVDQLDPLLRVEKALLHELLIFLPCEAAIVDGCGDHDRAPLKLSYRTRVAVGPGSVKAWKSVKGSGSTRSRQGALDWRDPATSGEADSRQGWP